MPAAKPLVGVAVLIVLGGFGWYASKPPGTAGDWALLDAARWGNEAECRKLLSEGADPNFTRQPPRYRLWFPGEPEPDQGYTPLHHAAEAGHLDVARILVEGGAKVNAKNALGNTPLVMATTMLEKEMVGYLLKSGADAATKNNAGLEAVDFAIKRNPEPVQEEIAAMLRAAGGKGKASEGGAAGGGEGP